MNTQEHDNLMRAIERDEAWLKATLERYPGPECPRLDGLKDQVRTELQVGSWLDAGLPESRDAVDGAKAAVWGALLRSAVEPAEPERRTQPWWTRSRVLAGTLAAAAAVALVALPFRWENSKSGTPAPVVVRLGIDDYSAALSLAATDDFDNEVAAVAAEIDELHDAFSLADDETLDAEFDDLDQELDSLYEEFDSFGDA